MSQKPLADQLRYRVEQATTPEGRAEARLSNHEWWEKFGSTVPAEQLAAVKAELGLAPDPTATPFREIVPDGWFKDLLDVQKESESPSPFFFLAGLAVFSNLVGRTVMIDHGTYHVGLDVSALLVSPAGQGRRSTACDFVVYTLGERAGLFTIADSFTYEAFADALIQSSPGGLDKDTRTCAQPRALAYAGEMSVLLGKGSYGESIIPKLTDIIGKTSKFSWSTVKRGGKIDFLNPMVNVLFTTAPDWLVDNISPIMFGGGTLSRILICVQDRSEQAVTWADAIPTRTIDKLVVDLRKLTTRTGLVGKPKGKAYKWYDDWYQAMAKTLRDGKLTDDRLNPYWSRRHDHLLRVATLLRLARGDSLELDVTSLEESHKILQYFEEGLPTIYNQMALSPVASAQQAVVRQLTKNGGMMQHSLLHKAVWRHVQLSGHFAQVMESLIEMGVVQTRVAPGKRGRYYHLKESLT